MRMKKEEKMTITMGSGLAGAGFAETLPPQSWVLLFPLAPPQPGTKSAPKGSC